MNLVWVCIDWQLLFIKPRYFHSLWINHFLIILNSSHTYLLCDCTSNQSTLAAITAISHSLSRHSMHYAYYFNDIKQSNDNATRYHLFVYNIGIQDIHIRIPYMYTKIVFVSHIGIRKYIYTNCSPYSILFLKFLFFHIRSDF